MDKRVEQGQDDAATQEEALASAMAGYNARGNPPPAEVDEEPQVLPEAVAPAIEAPAEPSIEERLAALKDEVKSMKDSGDPDAVRKLYGEIGNINRTIQQMQAAPKGDAPVTDEVAAALAEAESISEEFPEIGGPMVRALKAIAARSPKASEPDGAFDERVSAKVIQLRQAEALETLLDDHPDFYAVRETAEFKAWKDKQTPEYQQRINTTESSAVLSKALTTFKATQVTKQNKQDRLERLVSPQGVPNAGKTSTLPDEEGVYVGYNKGHKRLSR